MAVKGSGFFESGKRSVTSALRLRVQGAEIHKRREETKEKVLLVPSVDKRRAVIVHKLLEELPDNKRRYAT